MKILILILTIFVMPTLCFADTVTLTKDQFENISEMDKSIRKKYAQYKGFNGSADKLEVIGISKDSFMQEVSKMKPIDEINNDKKELEDEEILVKKRIRNLAIKSLKADGVVLKHVKEDEV